MEDKKISQAVKDNQYTPVAGEVPADTPGLEVAGNAAVKTPASSHRAEQLAYFKLPQKLSPRIKLAWRVADGLNTLLVGVILLGANIGLKGIIDPNAHFWILICSIVLFVGLFIWSFIAGPWWRYLCWSYQIEQRFILISHGVIFRKSNCIPFIRVQNTQIEQGPIFRMLGLGELSVSTAAGTHRIPGLPMEEANELRKTVAELARIAREDV